MSSLLPVAALVAGAVGSGRLEGGWEYVWASYIITWVTCALYAFNLWRRRLASQAETELENREPSRDPARNPVEEMNR